MDPYGTRAWGKHVEEERRKVAERLEKELHARLDKLKKDLAKATQEVADKEGLEEALRVLEKMLLIARTTAPRGTAGVTSLTVCYDWARDVDKRWQDELTQKELDAFHKYFNWTIQFWQASGAFSWIQSWFGQRNDHVVIRVRLMLAGKPSLTFFLDDGWGNRHRYGAPFSEEDLRQICHQAEDPNAKPNPKLKEIVDKEKGKQMPPN